MKQITFFVLLFGSLLNKAQLQNPTWIKLLKEDSTKQVIGIDSSYIFNALVLTHTLGGISAFSVTCSIYDNQQQAWHTCKDTSFAWSAIFSICHYNQDYAICKPNNNVLKLCLGRLDPAIRKKFIFRVTGSNGTTTKEYNF